MQPKFKSQSQINVYPVKVPSSASPEKIPQEAQKPELCIESSTPRIGSSWGYMHAGTIHSPVCTSCKTNSQNGDPCPICAEDIEAILQVMT